MIVFKYVLMSGEQRIQMPGGAVPLSAHVQRANQHWRPVDSGELRSIEYEQACLWMLCDAERERVSRRVYVVDTGVSTLMLHPDNRFSFVGTLLSNIGALVSHVFIEDE